MRLKFSHLAVSGATASVMLLALTPVGAQAISKVTGADIVDNTVASVDIQNGTLMPNDFASGTLPSTGGSGGAGLGELYTWSFHANVPANQAFNNSLIVSETKIPAFTEWAPVKAEMTNVTTECDIPPTFYVGIENSGDDPIISSPAYESPSANFPDQPYNLEMHNSSTGNRVRPLVASPGACQNIVPGEYGDDYESLAFEADITVTFRLRDISALGTGQAWN